VVKIRLRRDDEGAWKDATSRQRALGLIIGLVLSLGPPLLVIVLLALFVTGRLN